MTDKSDDRADDLLMPELVLVYVGVFHGVSVSNLVLQFF